MLVNFKTRFVAYGGSKALRFLDWVTYFKFVCAFRLVELAFIELTLTIMTTTNLALVLVESAWAPKEPITIELHGDEFWPLSGKPYFRAIIGKVYLRRPYQLVLPAKMHPALPSGVVPTYLTYKGKEWKMLYHKGHTSRYNGGWKSFEIDNNLKIGNGCVFELMECSKERLKFRVQILRGDIPSELPCKVNVENEDTRMVIE
ncbi:unnamed protein product [Dovyalis caffra]|uniref:TF-B3 domain-containing protein n=1 Tax=Dovyalis caffra TaxID=77055 RepID=A0AAV1S0G3_9ROSI|nr:unnamed protein product [Dovyalis caffra]